MKILRFPPFKDHTLSDEQFEILETVGKVDIDINGEMMLEITKKVVGDEPIYVISNAMNGHGINIAKEMKIIRCLIVNKIDGLTKQNCNMGFKKEKVFILKHIANGFTTKSDKTGEYFHETFEEAIKDEICPLVKTVGSGHRKITVIVEDISKEPEL